MEQSIDTINIELVVQAVQMGSDNIWMHGDLEIFINGEKPYAESDIINTDIFLESLKSDGEFFIFSCNCGIPKCSGWNKGVSVTHNKNNLTWENGNTGEIWLLDKAKIENDLIEIRTEVNNYKKYFSDKGIKYVGVGYNW